MKADTTAAVDFLQQLQPGGPWNLVAILPDAPSDKSIRKLIGCTFTEDQAGVVATWVAEQNRDRNIYYTLNGLLRALDTKPSREDIAAMNFLHVDIDPRPRTDVAEENERIRRLCEAMQPAPTAVVFSGGGYQALWRLAEPIPKYLRPHA